MPLISLGLCPALAQAAAAQGLAQPTPIQQAAIGPILQGADLLAQAQTGSGKTAAYALPLLQRYVQAPAAAAGRRRLQALVLAPTRELAAQIGESLRALAQSLVQPPRIAVVFGGVSINPQLLRLRGGADIVVATPGRLLDVVAHNALRLDRLSTLVLDEADRLLALGFADELDQVLALLPRQRQNLLFSATYPESVQQLARRFLHEPIEVRIAPAAPVEALLQQRAIAVDAHQRGPLLRQLLRQDGWSRVLVFVASQHGCEQLASKLRCHGVLAAPLHAGMSQGARQQALFDFKAGRLQALVTTDLAARGLDIAQLPVVVNYDLPRSAADYTHRIGRTARAGQGGLAVSLVSASTEAHFALIEKRQGLSLPREQIQGFAPSASALPLPVAASGNGGIKGRRPSKKDKLRAQALAGQPDKPPP